MKDLTKAEQTKLIESLTRSNAQLIQTKADQAEEIEQLQHAKDHAERRRLHLGDDFLQLWRDERTMRRRYQWLEEAAVNVVNSCSDHLPGLIVKLADELGIEVTENHGNT